MPRTEAHWEGPGEPSLARKGSPRIPPKELIQERTLARLWRDEGPRLPPLECDDGTRLRVVYPGRPSAAAGPDFRDALLLRSDGQLLRGDVEIHLRRGGWRAHGHHQDRRYNGVVLHVVLWPWDGAAGPIRLEMGARVPTTALFPVLGHTTVRRRPGVPTPVAPFLISPLESLGGHLDRAGDARFRTRTRSFPPAGQPRHRLYRGLMEALGYSRNREPFLALADGMPLRLLERVLMGVGAADRGEALQALLLGGAGLLEGPAQLLDKEVGAAATSSLQEHWQATALAPVVAAGAWVHFRIRPDNRPVRRLLGMARLLERTWEEGLLSAMVSAVREGTVVGLLEALTVGPPREGGRRASLIGAGRAGEMAVNVLLPFCAAWGSATGDRRLRASAWSLYRAWPALPENEVTREMRARLTVQGGRRGQAGPW